MAKGLGTAIASPDLAEFRAGLAKLDNPRRWSKELGRTQRDIGKKVAGWASGEASSMGGPYAHFAGKIKGGGGVRGAKVSVQKVANATFWGAKKSTGWHAGNDPSNHPKWIGASWDVGVEGQGPYAINNTIARRWDEIEEEYAGALDAVMSAALNYPSSTSSF